MSFNKESFIIESSNVIERHIKSISSNYELMALLNEITRFAAYSAGTICRDIAKENELVRKNMGALGQDIKNEFLDNFDRHYYQKNERE